MKLAIFTPAINKSAIGRMAAIVARELLQQGHQITIVRTEADHLLNTQIHDFGTQVLSWKDETEVADTIQRSDGLVYHLGNNYEFHEGALHWLSLHRGIVCLHDFFLASLFYGWAQSRRQSANAVLSTWYDADDANKFFSYSDSDTFIAGTHNSTPMTEWVCSQASAVITHSCWGCERVMASCPGPVMVVPLAYDAPGYRELKDLKRPETNTFSLLTIGHINPNKRVESVIRAIGDSPLLREKVVYRLVGAIEVETRNLLLNLARERDVNLEIWGEVDAEQLVEVIRLSDFISCLRWPTLEAASASAIEGMLYGKPIIVSDVGFYAELPDACTIKVDRVDEISAVRRALEELVNDPSRGRAMGAEAQFWASRTFTGSNYASQTIHMIELATRIDPVVLAVDRLCAALKTWAPRQDIVLDELSLARLSLFVDTRTDW